MDEKVPDLSIVVLAWQDRACLREGLSSIAGARGNLALEIILVENGIGLDEGEMRARLAGIPAGAIHFILNPTNRGVAPARNQGLRQARGRYVMLLDDDTRVDREALTTLVRFMDGQPKVGLAGPRLQDAAGNLQLTCRKLPTAASKLLRRIPTEWARTALADEMLAGYDHKSPQAVDYVIGACQIIRREAFQKVGALDEQFYYGPEDVDYCLRMWRAGWRVMYVPQATVVHDEQRLTRQRAISKLALVHAAGLARYFWKWKYVVTRPTVQAT